MFGPFGATFAVFKALIERKKKSCRQELADGGYDKFLQVSTDTNKTYHVTLNSSESDEDLI